MTPEAVFLQPFHACEMLRGLTQHSKELEMRVMGLERNVSQLLKIHHENHAFFLVFGQNS